MPSDEEKKRKACERTKVWRAKNVERLRLYEAERSKRPERKEQNLKARLKAVPHKALYDAMLYADPDYRAYKIEIACIWNEQNREAHLESCRKYDEKRRNGHLVALLEEEIIRSD